ncbi:MAG TPA: hypothetical protein VMU16_07060 [Candidatus Binataceae bacterium]|nr:hypothetical protein [Candidatus Binataceae bacterium]
MKGGAFLPSPLGSFPLCADPRFQDEVRAELQALTDQVSACAATKYFEGLILTGSFARGEGTVIDDPSSQSRWLSDIECLVVVKNGRVSAREIKDSLRRIQNEVNLKPANGARGIKAELRAMTRSRLERLGPTIFANELCAYGKLLWGVSSGLPMPAFEITGPQVSKHDAFRLLNNRIIEQISVRSGFTGETDGGSAAAYSLAKFWIDLATSLSIFMGCYQPGYRNRQAPFEDYLRLHPEILGRDISASLGGHYRDAMAIKLGQRRLKQVASVDEFRQAAEVARAAWYWESAQLLGFDPDSADWRGIFSRLSRLETSMQRFRGWVRLFRRPARLGGLGPRALIAAARSGSLATLIYGTGCVVDFFWEDIGSTTRRGEEIAAALCPALAVRANDALERRRMLAGAALKVWQGHLRFTAA